MLPRTLPFRARAPWFGGHLQTLRALRWPAAAPLPLGERLWLPLSDGDALAAMLHLPPRRPGAPLRPLAVLVHGLAGTEADTCVREAASALLRRGFPVLRLNLRGSAPGRPRSTSHYHLGRSGDLAEALAALPPALTGAGILLAGWSLGGAMAILLLARDAAPALLGGAAISAPLQPEVAHATIDADPVLGRALLALYRREILAVAPARDLPETLRRRALAAASLREMEARVTAPRFGYPSYEVFVEVHRPAAVLPALRRPLLLLQAADDPLVPPDVLDGIAWSECPAVLPLLVAGGGHCGFHDAGHAESLAVRALAGFFEGLADQAPLRGASAAAAMDQGDASSASSRAQQAASTAAA